MFNLKFHIKNLLKIILILVLILWQLLSTSLFNGYGVNEQCERNSNNKTIKMINDVHSETLFTIKDVKGTQNLFPNLENQKYKYDSKYSLYQTELLLLGCLVEKKEFHYQKVEKGNLNPRSPPQYHI
jgi:hypothetical protein